MNYYRTIFISDLHLGGSCNHSALKEFLHNNDADTWYIVGDFLDLWAGGWCLDDSLIIQSLISKTNGGQRIIIIPGNHDAILRAFEHTHLGGVEIVDNTIFTTSSGRTYLVLHGDLFDVVIGHAVWLARMGSVGYTILIFLNKTMNIFRKLFHLPYWSFSAAIKKTVKRAVSYISDFKNSLVQLTHTYGTQGVICGHIHTPEHSYFRGVEYFNAGDWVESLTAIVELPDGTLELKYYDKN